MYNKIVEIKEINGKLYKRWGKEWKQVVKVNCHICGKEIYRNPWRLTTSPPTCSYKCIGENTRNKINDSDLEIFKLNNTRNFNYLLGILSADGYIWDKNNQWSCSLGLNNKDIELLYSIKGIFGGRITKHSENASRWKLFNKPFVKWLIDIGITRAKTHTINIDDYFNSISDENKYAFIRGVIDGDGHIDYYQFSITGCSLSFLEMCHKFLNAGNIIKAKSWYNLVIGKESYNCLSKIYNVSAGDLFLNRKYNSYKIIEERIKNGK